MLNFILIFFRWADRRERRAEGGEVAQLEEVAALQELREAAGDPRRPEQRRGVHDTEYLRTPLLTILVLELKKFRLSQRTFQKKSEEETFKRPI